MPIPTSPPLQERFSDRLQFSPSSHMRHWTDEPGREKNQYGMAIRHPGVVASVEAAAKANANQKRMQVCCTIS